MIKIFAKISILLLSLLLLASPNVLAEKPPSFPIEQLKTGGYVVYFRHAKRDKVASSSKFYEIDSRNLCVPGGELNAQGRDESRWIKAKMDELMIPVGNAYASPTCRTKQMATILFGDNFTVTKGIAPVWINRMKTKDHLYEELNELLRKDVPEGKNRFLISHGGVLNEKTVGIKITLQQSDAAVFKPDTKSTKGYTFLGIIPKKSWR